MSPTPKAALIWLLLPRTMYWSIPSMKRVNPTTHMGQFVTTMRRGEAAVRCAAERCRIDRLGHRRPVGWHGNGR